MLCSACGTAVPQSARFCAECGAAQPAATGTTQRLAQPAATGATTRLTRQPTAGLRTGTCPSCDAQTVISTSAGLVARGDVIRLNLHDFWGTSVVITTYLCTSCGALELALTDPADAHDLQIYWAKRGH